jgi:hypothetical protein
MPALPPPPLGLGGERERREAERARTEERDAAGSRQAGENREEQTKWPGGLVYRDAGRGRSSPRHVDNSTSAAGGGGGGFEGPIDAVVLYIYSN